MKRIIGLILLAISISSCSHKSVTEDTVKNIGSFSTANHSDTPNGRWKITVYLTDGRIERQWSGVDNPTWRDGFVEFHFEGKEVDVVGPCIVEEE